MKLKQFEEEVLNSYRRDEDFIDFLKKNPSLKIELSNVDIRKEEKVEENNYVVEAIASEYLEEISYIPEMTKEEIEKYLETLDEDAVDNVIIEVADEMFQPIKPQVVDNNTENEIGMPSSDGPIKDVQYYKTMLTELTDALDNAISHKIKLTRYIDNLLKKKYKTYVRLKSDD